LAKLDVKGQNNNLVFIFGPGNFEELAELVKDRVENNMQLFSGSPVLFQGDGLKDLSPEELVSLQKMCLDYGMVLNNMTTQSSPAPRPERITPPPSRDLMIYKTLRSGQKVHSEGSIIIWGDVHESAEITAANDVVVLGRLEGLAHAGCFGDLNSTIFALTLTPRQLRIADRISRSSGKIVKNPYPEIAYVEGEGICIKEYSNRDNINK
jgi:septum site-determining protein MinC